MKSLYHICHQASTVLFERIRNRFNIKSNQSNIYSLSHWFFPTNSFDILRQGQKILTRIQISEVVSRYLHKHQRSNFQKCVGLLQKIIFPYLWAKKNRVWIYGRTISTCHYGHLQRLRLWEIKFLCLGNNCTTQKMKFFIKDFFSFLRIWSHLQKKLLMENFSFCAVLP